MIEVNIKNTILIFIISGFIGWIILSIFSGELYGYLWKNFNIPFKPMFAIGTVLIFLIYPYNRHCFHCPLEKYDQFLA